MESPLEPTVLLDTDVFSLLFVDRARRDGRTVEWRSSLRGARAAIATQTSAELLGGALAAA